MIVIVMGMHRSGTSALAGMLHENGICMGEDQNFYPPPSAENPKGFFENYRFRSVNDHILSENNYWAENFSPMTPDDLFVSLKSQDIMRTLIYEYSQRYVVWGWKDPRTCLTYSAWEPVLKPPYTSQTVKTILVTRSYETIADSMIARGNIGEKRRFVALAKEYYKKALTDVGAFSAIVKFEDLIKNTQAVVDYLSDRLMWPITDISFIDPKISKQSKKT